MASAAACSAASPSAAVWACCNAANAIWNFAYSCAAAEVGIALRGVGLDPGISPTGLHTDVPRRDSATWDALEAIRGQVDAVILTMLQGRRFRRRDFAQLPDGRVRLTAPLARDLAEAVIPLSRQAVAPVAEEVARMIADGVQGAPSHIPGSPTNLTGDARSRGRDGIRKGARKSSDAAAKAKRNLIPAACRRCGVILEVGRRVCHECRCEVQAENTQTLAEAGRERLAAMRAAPDDPARSPRVKAKLGAAVSRRLAENRKWEGTHEMPDPSEWEAIFAGLADVTVWAMGQATGLSPATCRGIKRGEGKAHPRHWAALRGLSRG